MAVASGWTSFAGSKEAHAEVPKAEIPSNGHWVFELWVEIFLASLGGDTSKNCPDEVMASVASFLVSINTT